MGKTQIALELGYIISTRQFFQDGVFYFNMRDMVKQKQENSGCFNLIEFMGETLGTDFQQKITYYFKNKHMLLIFD